jgi:hypothetical protein
MCGSETKPGSGRMHRPADVRLAGASVSLIFLPLISFEGDFMYKRFTFYMLILSFLLLSGLQKANAGATLSSSSVTCSSFNATGTVTTPFVGVRIWNLSAGQSEGGPALIDSYFNVGAPTAYFPASGGAFSFTVNFPIQTAGNIITARVYAAPTAAFGSWDGGAFPQVELTCSNLAPVPTLAGWMMVMLAIVLGAVGLLAAGRRRRV